MQPATHMPACLDSRPRLVSFTGDVEPTRGASDARPGATPYTLALGYLERGWAPIPIAHRLKAPSLNDWTKLRITADQAAEYFRSEDQNVGVLLGEPSGGLIDIDLDVPETVMLAPRFLPETLTFGRASKRRSHWLFTCPDTTTATFKAPDGTMLVEIRSTGAQTVFPGSTHKSGEAIEFEEADRKIAKVESTELEKAVRRLATASLLARHWPQEGSRQEAALALSGALLRAQWEDDEAEQFIEAVAEAADDEESSMRTQCVRYTRQKLDKNEPATGLPRLKELVGEAVVKKVAEWLDLSAEMPAWIEEMNSKYFVVNEVGKAQVYQMAVDEVLKREILVRYTFEDLRKLYLNDRVCLDARKDEKHVIKDKATAWLEHKQRRQYLGGVVFAPGAVLPPDKYNLWRGFAIEPRPGNWSLMREHLLKVICSGNNEHFEYLFGWLARAVQYPGEQGGVAVVLRGGRGVGKGTVGNALLRIFGQHGVYLTNSKHLTGNFNAHLRDAVFLFVDEAFFAGDRAHESVLKGLITDPYLTIEAKYQNATTVRNMTHILMASNERWVVPAGEDERRFFVLEVSDRHKQDQAYFDALHAEMDGSGLGAMLHELLNFDLAGFKVNAVPKTDALTEQKLHSLRGVDAWLLECLQDGSIDGHGEWTEAGLTISKTFAYQVYKNASKQLREYTPLNNAQWGKSVRKALEGCVREQRPRRKEPTKPYEQTATDSGLGVSARARELVFAPLSDCRAAFARYLNAEINWGEEEGDE